MLVELARTCYFEVDVSLAAVTMMWVDGEDGRKTETGIKLMHLPTIDICTGTTCCCSPDPVCMPPDCGRLRICTTLITFMLLAAKSWMYAVGAGQGGHNLSGIYQACALQIERRLQHFWTYW